MVSVLILSHSVSGHNIRIHLPDGSPKVRRRVRWNDSIRRLFQSLANLLLSVQKAGEVARLVGKPVKCDKFLICTRQPSRLPTVSRLRHP